ncbi:YutD family protein [Weissella paramesenteroides]|uniref:YutD family protein n=1 Tax=Weissella paramesenteroides TaxID=1249 RepID=UPI003F2284EF
MNRERMKELADAQFIERQAGTAITMGDTPEDIFINERPYRLVKDYREAYDQQKMAARFSDFLEKYDFIVGDIAADQLRLQGFYKDGTKGIARSQQISALQDFLYEEANFGAPFFVLENLAPHEVVDVEEKESTKSKRRRRQHRHSSNGSANKKHANKQQNHVGTHHENKKHKSTPVMKERINSGHNPEKHVANRSNSVATSGSKKRRHFQVRERSKNKTKDKA